MSPAWGDANLRELAAHIESHMFIAHVRATTGTAIQETNCHPFRHGRWLFVHNGVIAGFHEMRRELMLEVAPELFPEIEGSTDSEVLFHLALTYGLEHDPVAALERRSGSSRRRRSSTASSTRCRRASASPTASGCGRSATRRRAFAHAVRVERRAAIRELHPENPRLQRLQDEDRVVVSEPLSDLPGLWQEIPESTVLVVQPGPDEQRPFHPRFEPRAQPALS